MRPAGESAENAESGIDEQQQQQQQDQLEQLLAVAEGEGEAAHDVADGDERGVTNDVAEGEGEATNEVTGEDELLEQQQQMAMEGGDEMAEPAAEEGSFVASEAVPEEMEQDQQEKGEVAADAPENMPLDDQPDSSAIAEATAAEAAQLEAELAEATGAPTTTGIDADESAAVAAPPPKPMPPQCSLPTRQILLP